MSQAVHGKAAQVLIPLIIAGILFLLRFASSDRNNRRLFNWGDFNICIYSLTAVLIIISLTALLRTNELANPDVAIKAAVASSAHRYEQFGYELKMLRNPQDLSLHYRTLKARTKAIEHDHSPEQFNFFDNSIRPENFYAALMKSPHQGLRDAGKYGTAFLLMKMNPDSARMLLDKISTRKNSVALLMAETEPQTSGAIAFLETEINNEGNYSDAVPLLASLYYTAGKFGGLFHLSNKKETALHVPAFYRTLVALEKQKGIVRIPAMLKNFFRQAKGVTLIFSSLIFLTFMLFLRYFSPYDLKSLVPFSFCSILFFLIATPMVYDLIHRTLGFRQNGEPLNDLAYFIAGIGLTEEILKAIPFIAVLLLLRIKDAGGIFSIALLSAANFAFAEVIMNSDQTNIASVCSRTVWLILMHGVCFSIPAYLLCLSKFKWKSQGFVWLFSGICFAAIAHGIYDYCLVSDNWIISFLILITGIAATGRMLNNTLSNSADTKMFLGLNYAKIVSAFAGAIILQAGAEYLTNYIAHGFYPANAIMTDALMTLSLPVTLFVIRISQTDVFPDKWRPLALFTALNPFPFLMKKQTDFSLFAGKGIVIRNRKNSNVFPGTVSFTGLIISRESISGYEAWFRVKPERPLTINKTRYDEIFFRTLEKNAGLKKDPATACAIYVNANASGKEEIIQEDLVFIDYVLISFV